VEILTGVPRRVVVEARAREAIDHIEVVANGRTVADKAYFASGSDV
jgi:hypothetical protein